MRDSPALSSPSLFRLPSPASDGTGYFRHRTSGNLLGLRQTVGREPGSRERRRLVADRKNGKSGREGTRLGRGAGVLLHVTSLPSPYGIGDLGPPAYRWVDALARAKQTWWQILPLGPAGAGNSPYQSFSAFAGNAMLISPELLVKDGLLKRSEAAETNFPTDRVSFAMVNEFKTALLAFAWDRFQEGAGKELREAYKQFRDDESDWLDDYALFMALKEAHGRA